MLDLTFTFIIGKNRCEIRKMQEKCKNRQNMLSLMKNKSIIVLEGLLC